jgi:uroporphyrinogen-III synthase
MRVLITRPSDEALELAGELAARGIDSLIEPMIRIVMRADAKLELDDAQAVLLTSANGARALAAASTERQLPVLAVGEATARAARAAGFANVITADGTVATLADAAKAKLNPMGDRVVHVSGAAIAGDLTGALAGAGFAVERAIVYDARAADELSPAARQALADSGAAGGIDAVLLYSPRTARIFVALARRAGLESALRRLRGLCLSAQVCEAAGIVPWARLAVAARPNGTAMLELVTRELATMG